MVSQPYFWVSAIINPKNLDYGIFEFTIDALEVTLKK